MQNMHIARSLAGVFGRKSGAVIAMAALLVFNLGPLEAKAADVVVSCSVSGSFTVASSGGQVVANNSSTCSGTAVIPDGVTSIGLFQNNTNLLRVEIPASVTTIAGFAFANSSNLAEVVFAANSNLAQVGPYTFTNTKLTSFQVPARVTSIGDAAFDNCTRLTSITFEAGSQLQSIGTSAFNRAGLTSISLPSSLTSLGSSAFSANTALASVTFGAGSQLTTVGNNAFTGLPQSTIALPASVTSIGSSPFGSNIRLTVADANPNYSVQNGVLFNKTQTTLIAYAPWLTDSTYVIPASVTTLSGSAFIDSQLQTLNIPATVSTIGTYAFARSPRLTEVTFSPNSTLTRIPSAAFQASGLLRITIPASVTHIEGYALNTSLLEQVTFAQNSSLQEISNNVFMGARLTSVEIPASVQSIGADAFSSNTLLTTVTFASGSNLRYLGARSLGNRVTTLSFPAAPVRSGYRFNGWSNTSAGATVANATTSAIAGQELFAKWLALSTVTFNSNAGSAVANGSFGQGETVAAPVAPTRSGFAFVGWSLTNGGSAISFPYSPASSANFTLYALWDAVPTVSAGLVADSQVVSIPVGITAAEVPATSILPKVSLAFAATSASASATIVPIDNPASSESTPFTVTGSTKIVDIQVSGITGPVTVCLDGTATDQIFHFTGGAWVELPQRTFANGQVCGVTESFSPFAAAEPRPIVQNVSYTGPRISGRSGKIAQTTGGSEFRILGDRLSQVNSVTLEGKPLSIVSKSDSEIVINAPAHAAGYVDLVLKSDASSLTFQDAFEYRAPASVRLPVITSKTTVSVIGSAKSLTAGQRLAIGRFVESSNSGTLLTCSATYTSKADLAAAKLLAAAACVTAKKENSGIATRVAAPVLVKSKQERKILLSLSK